MVGDQGGLLREAEVAPTAQAAVTVAAAPCYGDGQDMANPVAASTAAMARTSPHPLRGAMGSAGATSVVTIATPRRHRRYSGTRAQYQPLPQPQL